MATGPHKIEFEALEGWDRLPEGYATSKSRVSRATHTTASTSSTAASIRSIIFDKDGKFLNAWGKGVFKNPHGIFIDDDDYLWLADDKDHTVHKFTADGERLMTLGESGKPSDTGYKIGESPVKRAAGPFHRVTNVAVLPNGDMYIADGYGNARVHKFSEDGKLLFSWGEPGQRPRPVHAAARHRGGQRGARLRGRPRELTRAGLHARRRVLARVGDVLSIVPYDIFIDDQDMLHIAEGGFHNYMMKRSEGPLPAHDQTMIYPPCGHSPIARVTVCDPDGEDRARRSAAKIRSCPETSSRRTASGSTAAATSTSAKSSSTRAR